MQYIFAKVTRVFIRYISSIFNFFRIIFIKLKYPNVSISFSTKLERGISVKCSNNSKIQLSNTTINAGTIIHADHGGVINIKDSFIGRNCVIVAREKITIDANCQIAEMVVIRDQNHNFGLKDRTIESQGFSVSPIHINNNVWLAAKVTVTAGSVIGENTVVGANAVVRGSLAANCVYAGVPVKKIKSF